MAKCVRGICESFCPEKETKLRTQESLLHFYELKNGKKNVPGILVKTFSRSAAGLQRPQPRDLRTFHCLQRTVEYLLKEIFLDKRKSYNHVYDFIFDRLRAVRQEIVMQEFSAQQTIKLLEPIILFLSYSRYRLCDQSVDNFDPKICEQHLQECLKRILCCYDEISIAKISDSCTIKDLKNQHLIESLYQLFNLGSTEALYRYIHLPKKIRLDPLLSSSYLIGLHYFQGNYYRVLTGIKILPHILCAVASLKLQEVRRRIYQTFAVAFNSKQLTVPVGFICDLMNYCVEEDLYADCAYYNLLISKDRTGIHFEKENFRKDLSTPKSRHENIVEKKLKCIYLPEILLLNKF